MPLVNEDGVIDSKALSGHYKRFAMTRARAGLKWIKDLGVNEQLMLTRVDPTTVDIADPMECVLSQVASGHSYGWVVERFGLTDLWLIEHGFEGCMCEESAHADAHIRVYDALNGAWSELLTPQES